MRIAFDGTTLRPGRTGVGYYSEHLLRHLVSEQPDDEIIVVSNQAIDTTTPLPSRVQIATSSYRVPRMVWMQMFAPRLLERLRPDVVHFTNGMVPLVSRVPTVVTIHDMSLTLYPRYHPPRRVLLNRPFVDLAARRADAIITVSESAKDDITRIYKLSPERVHVVHEAAAPAFRPVTDAAVLRRVRDQYGLSDRFILSVGSIEPRKNLPTLIEAFARRHKTGELPHQLVCAGPYGWLSGDLDERIDRLRVANAIRFTGYVPFEDLSALYTLAEMFVFPSIYEGFGLPIIEAMAAGTPVVTTRTGSLGEVAGDAAFYVDRLNPEALGDAMVQLSRDPVRRHELRTRGLSRARAFSWDRSARETRDIYQQVAEARGVSPKPARRGIDVLFGQAYFLHFDPKLRDAGQPYPPLGTLYAAAVARARGYSVALFDAMLAQSTDEWAQALDRHRPRVAVLYEDSFNYLSKMCLLRMRDAALTMIRAARERGIGVIVSGSDATDHAELYLEAGATRVILGEGEVTLAETLDSLLGGARIPIDAIAGLARQNRDGVLAKTAPREIVRELDSLPRPAWDLVDVDRYRAEWMGRHGYFSMNLVTTRGCPYHCNWCAKPIYGQRYGSRSPAHVVDEMKWLKDTYRPDHLWMADDIFGLKPGWIEQFAALARERDAVVPFKCLLRADGVTEPVARALAAAGCRTAWIGAESGSQKVLDAMEKGTSVEQIRMAAERLHRAGIEVGFFLQFGYPGETLDDIALTRRMVRECRPDDIGISVSYPLPGTRFYERVKAELGHKQNWIDSDDLAMMYRATYVPEFYRTLHSVVHAEFRARRGLATVMGAAKRPQALRHLLHEATAAAYHAFRLPVLERRLRRLSRQEQSGPAVHITHELSRQAAAVPSEPSADVLIDLHAREVEQHQ